MLPAEQAAPLKLLEKGVSKEALAGLVLLEFPCELASAVLAGRWASSPTPFAPFMLGYKIRLVMAAAVTLVVSHVFGTTSLLDLHVLLLVQSFPKSHVRKERKGKAINMSIILIGHVLHVPSSS